jgi:hypothetical protein
MRPVCSFCGRKPVAVWFDGPTFLVGWTSPEDVRGDEAWLACSTCARLVAAGDRAELARRSARRVGKRSDTVPSDELVERMLGQHERTFWAARTA